MLRIEVPEREFFDEEHNRFFTVPAQTLELEHSLISVSKWESKFQKPFLSTVEKTDEEIMSYIEDMTINRNVDPLVFMALTESNLNKINAYINSEQTATTFNESVTRGGVKQVVTSELIYYWMIALSIPFECQKWHFNRLLTLIRICNIKNDPKGGRRMTKAEIIARNRSLNEQRRAQLGTKG